MQWSLATGTGSNRWAAWFICCTTANVLELFSENAFFKTICNLLMIMKNISLAYRKIKFVVKSAANILDIGH